MLVNRIFRQTEIGVIHEEMVRLGTRRTQSAAIRDEKVLLTRRGTHIGRIFTDTHYPRASASSVQSVFYRNSAIINEDNKPQINADERRYLHITDFCKTTHRKGRKELKAVQQEPLCSPWLNAFSIPVHERAPPALAVHLRTNHGG